jgi:hypothetical protein
MGLVATILSSPQIASAAQSGDECSALGGTSYAGEIGCSILSITRGGSTIDYGTYGFYNADHGRYEEEFCIAFGVLAQKDSADTGNTSNLEYTGLGANRITVPDKGMGNDAENAKYIISKLRAMYFNLWYNDFRDVTNEDLYGANLLHSMPGSSIQRVKVAASLALIIHAWFNERILEDRLNAYFDLLPHEYYDLAYNLIGRVPNISTPEVSNLHVAADNQSGELFLMANIPTGANYYLKDLPTSEWVIKSTGNTAYLQVKYQYGQNIRICTKTEYQLPGGVFRDINRGQSNMAPGEMRDVERCTGQINRTKNFNLQVSSKMAVQLYQTGNIIDQIQFSYSGAWPCDALTDPLSIPGSCSKYADVSFSNQLFKKNAPGDSAGEISGSAVNFSALGVIPNGAPTSGREYLRQVNFGVRASGFYTSQTTVSTAWLGNVQHPLATLNNNDETVSTYRCPLNVTSKVSDYHILAGDAITDSLVISGRCDGNAPNSGPFARQTSAEVLLYGPLSELPGASNNSTTPPRVKCRAGGSNCVFWQKSVEMQNGSVAVGNITEQIKPTDEGYYVFVYHFGGDVFTPQYYSDATDRDETFYVALPNMQMPITMWSKATPNARPGGAITDTVYLAGDIRPGSYLQFDAYQAQNPTSAPECSGAKLLEGSSHQIAVGARGGTYTSPPISSSALGVVYWIATLYDANGEVYLEKRTAPDGSEQSIAWQGICGEAGESTAITWNPLLRTSARAHAMKGEEIWDVALVVAPENSVPEGLQITFTAYKDGVQMFEDVQDLQNAGEVRSNAFSAHSPGNYFWVARILDQFGNVIAAGELGEPSEVSHVFDIRSDVSQKYLQSGRYITDTFHVEGAISGGQSGEYRLVPKLWMQGEDQPRHVFESITLSPSRQEYTTPEFQVHQVGSYYFTYDLLQSVPSGTGEETCVKSTDHEVDPRESFEVVDTTSQAQEKAFIGEYFTDEVTLLGAFPQSSCITFSLYYTTNSVNAQNDKNVYTSDCQEVVQDPDPLPNISQSPAFENDAEPEVGVPQNVYAKITSPTVNQITPGRYYWVERVYNDAVRNYQPANASSTLIAQGERRLHNETTEVVPLTNSAYLYSETSEHAYINEPFRDTVVVTGKIPQSGHIIWKLFRQDDNSTSVHDDQLVLTTAPKDLSEGVLLNAEGEEVEDATDATLLRISSEDVSMSTIGQYYWVEMLYSDLQKPPVAVGAPRLKNETVQILPLTGIARVMSKADDFVRAGQEFGDLVYVKPVVEAQTQALFENAYVTWNVYRKNLSSFDWHDDKLVKTISPVPLEFSNYVDGVFEIRSPQIAMQEPGVYYWREELHVDNQIEAIDIQEPRAFSETTIVEAGSNKYVKLGKRKVDSSALVELATTGVAIGHLVGTACIVTVIAYALLRRKWAGCDSKRRRIRRWK